MASSLLLALGAILSVGPSAALQSDDYYCGITWPNAANACPKHCPSGEDSECRDALGEAFSCFYFTGCKAKIASGEITNGDNVQGNQEGAEGGDGTNNNFCGTSWVAAMKDCGVPCPKQTECTGPGEKCFAATGCDRPLERLRADMQVTLLGAGEYDMNMYE